MFTFHNYWNYFKDDFDWPDNFVRPDIARTRQIFEQAGIPAEEHNTLIESGYVNVRGDTIIDRYYGGPIMSIDSITRFDMDTFKMWYEAAKSRTPMFRKPPIVTSATSIGDLEPPRYTHLFANGPERGLPMKICSIFMQNLQKPGLKRCFPCWFSVRNR